MSLLSRVGDWLRGKSGSETPVVGSELRGWYDDYGQSNAGVAVNAFTALAHTSVMACVSILSEDVAKIPLQVFRHTANGGKAIAREHFLHPLLRRPNRWQTAMEFKEMLMGALVLRGNAYAVIVRDQQGIFPEMLVPIHPDRVALYEAPGGEWFYVISRSGLHEMAVLRDVPWFVPAEDVLHIKWLSSWNSLLGVSRIQMMREAVGLSISQELHQARFAGGGARPAGILSTEQTLTPERGAQLAADWTKAYGGWRNSGRTVVLEQGLKWQALGMTMADAQFIESRRFSLEDIARGFRVPLHKLGVPSASGSESTLVQLDQDYLNSVISSYCERFIAKMEATFDVDGEDYFLAFDYNHFLKADIQTRLTALRTGVAGMIYTPDEARAAEGLPPVKGGDVLYQPTNVAPIGFTPAGAGGSGPGSDFTGTPAPGGDGDPGRPSGDTPASSS